MDYKVSRSILVLGASYGLVLGLKAAHSGHRVHFVCREHEVELINAGKAYLRLPSKTDGSVVTLSAEKAQCKPAAYTPEDLPNLDYDLCVLAMQEPQFSSPELTQLVAEIGKANIPLLSIMNMPLPIFLKGKVAFSVDELSGVWQSISAWQWLDATRFSAASPDPQAMMIQNSDALSVHVNHAANIKVAPFANTNDQQVLIDLAQSIDGLRVQQNGKMHQLGMRLVAHSNELVSMAKWPMLITGNFRCWTSQGPVSIADAVHSDLDQSRLVYEWVGNLCAGLASEANLPSPPLVSFERYAQAAKSLTLPSSLARGLAAGATRVERVDLLLQGLASQRGMASPQLSIIVDSVNDALKYNSLKATS